MTDARAWLAAMPPAVARQRAILERLLDAVAADPDVRWLELGCSLARGAGDQLSDIDAALGVTGEPWDRVDRLRSMLDRLAPTLDGAVERLPGSAGPRPHLVTLYADGMQLSLVVMTAASRPGLPPGSVALLDRDGQLGAPWTPAGVEADATTVAEWQWLGWLALGDLAKYLDRGSPWEAHARLEQARGLLWQLWAAAERVPFPAYGLAGVLDEPEPRLPPGIERTVAGLDAAALRRAALATADLLVEVGTRVGNPPAGLAGWVRGRLTAG